MKRYFIHCLLAAATTFPVFGKTNADLVVGERTLVQRIILEGPSTRMIAVGQPGGFNYAFDALNGAPAYAWTGGFLDYGPEISGRGGGRCKILGVKRALGIDLNPLRIGDAETPPESIRFGGYRRDEVTGDPTFLFAVDGVPVEQRLSSPGPDKVSIELSFPGKGKVAKYYRIDPTPHVLIRLGKELRWSGPGVVEIPAGVSKAVITVRLKSTGKNFVREVEVLTGEEIYRNFCSACHSTDGTKLIGPSFKGAWGSEKTVLRNGKPETVTVNEEYVRESILKPQAAIVKGYELVPMADFSAVLTAEQIESLIGYLRELE